MINAVTVAWLEEVRDVLDEMGRGRLTRTTAAALLALTISGPDLSRRPSTGHSRVSKAKTMKLTKHKAKASPAPGKKPKAWRIDRS
jgi:hypothetical protein